MFKVRYINVTLKALKDQLDEINQGLNPGDTRRVEYIWYERPTLDDGRITFSRLELKNDDDVRSMFSIFGSTTWFRGSICLSRCRDQLKIFSIV